MPEVYENFMALQSVFPEHQEYTSYGHDPLPMSDTSVFSPYSGSTNSQGASVASPMSTSLSPIHGTDYLTLQNVTVEGEAHITILVQPVEKFRFRYKSEMIGTHGSLVGTNNTSSRKKHAPTVQLHNYSEKAIIRCTLVTSDESQRIPHAHRLVRREGNTDRDDPYDITVSAETGFIASFHGMGIIHTAKKHVRDELIRKMRMEALERVKRKNINATLNTREEAQIKADAECYQKCVNLNSVALCFQAFIVDHNDVMIPLTAPVYSHPINNLKSALTGELKICRIDKITSSCEGGEEVFILVEKVGKKNIKIKFFEVDDEDREIWKDYGLFSELDVHHQYAIVFRTPPYKDLNITSSKEVFIQLERPSDGDSSEPLKFTYKPSGRVMGLKRQRMSYSNSIDLSHIIPNYNAMETRETQNLSSNESRDFSKELKNILSDGCSSTELMDFISHIDVDKYTQLLGNSDENMLVSDSSSTKRYEDDTMFAQNIVTEAIKCIKMNPKNAKVHLQKLFKDRSTYGDSPLHAALRYGQRDIVKYILMLVSTDKDCKALINEQNSSGKTPLHYAVLQNQPEITQVLLMLGADPNKFDDHGSSPLHAGVRIPDAGACVDALLSNKNTNIEAHNDAGWTALQLAAEAGSYHAVRSLVKAGANVNNTDMLHGRTTLHIAVEGGHKAIVEFLLKKTDIDVNKRNFSGNTALHSAVVYSGTRAKDLCSLLIQHGADPHIQTRNWEVDDDDRSKIQPDGIKVEADSEDENAEEKAGESSFDLASNKSDILQLLTSQNQDAQNEVFPISTKEEDIDDSSEENWLTTEQQKKLSALLNKRNAVKKLAEHLNLESFLESFQQSTANPSLLLLQYIDIQLSVSLVDLENALRNVGEEEAANYVRSILSSR